MLAAIIPAVIDLVGRFIPDPTQKAKAVQELTAMLMEADRGQMAINLEEAKSQSLFVSGWRPFIGWACGAALVYSYLLVPLTMYVAMLAGRPIPRPPVLDANLWELMFGLFGMGALRTIEKLRDKAAR